MIDGTVSWLRGMLFKDATNDVYDMAYEMIALHCSNFKAAQPQKEVNE